MNTRPLLQLTPQPAPPSPGDAALEWLVTNGLGGYASGSVAGPPMRRFHGWLIVEVFTDAGHVGIGNAALSPYVTKAVIDRHLTPLLLGQNPWDVEFLWQHMYRKTMAWGRKGLGMVAISAVDIALWDVLGKAAGQPVYRLLGGRTKRRIPVYASRLYSTPLDELAAEARAYKDAGYKAMGDAMMLLIEGVFTSSQMFDGDDKPAKAVVGAVKALIAAYCPA